MESQANVLGGGELGDGALFTLRPELFRRRRERRALRHGTIGRLRHLEAVASPLTMTGEICDVVEHATGASVDRDPVLETLHAALPLRLAGSTADRSCRRLILVEETHAQDRYEQRR